MKKHARFSIDGILCRGSLLLGGLLLAFCGAIPARGNSLKTHHYGTATIYVDHYGVPHIFGPTDASVIYASAWVEANADWPLVESNFLRSIGRASEFYGVKSLGDDYLDRALRIPQLAREEYAHESKPMRKLLDAYAAGFNDWLAAHPQQRHWLRHVEPWYTLALLRYKYDQLEFLGDSGFHKSMEKVFLKRGWPIGSHHEPAVATMQGGTDFEAGSITRFAENIRGPLNGRPIGSNEWALGPSRTADGHAMLLINPHQKFFGIERYFEIDLHSRQGLVFSGITRFGFLLPYMGNNARLGWTYTDNYPDIGDLYVEKFDVPAHPLSYRYGDAHETARTWTETVKVKNGNKTEKRTLRFWATRHGPVIGLDRHGRPLAVRLARLRHGGWDDQLYAMIRSRSLQQFKRAESMLDIPYMNLMYADDKGNIWYVYNGAVPKRDPSFDWGKPVDGSDPRTEWHGYHTLAELPQVLNPKSGFLLNCNSSPMYVTTSVPYKRQDFPSYMIGNETDNPRARSSLRVLSKFHKVLFDAFARAVWDSRLSAADRMIPKLEAEWKDLQQTPTHDIPESLQKGTQDRRDMPFVMKKLADWDRVSRIESVPTTWFVYAMYQWYSVEGFRPKHPGRFSLLESLAETLDVLRKHWGTIEVPWGELSRLQRPPSDNPEDFSAALPSLAVGGGPSALGSVFAFYRYTRAQLMAGTISPSRPAYGLFGNSFVKVVDFGPQVEARSIIDFGESSDPKSPHFFDQAPLYAQRLFKPAWFTLKTIKAHTEKTLHVGRD